MVVGCHGLLWTDRYDDLDTVDDAIARIAAADYDLIEIPLMNHTDSTPRGPRRR